MRTVSQALGTTEAKWGEGFLRLVESAERRDGELTLVVRIPYGQLNEPWDVQRQYMVDYLAARFNRDSIYIGSQPLQDGKVEIRLRDGAAILYDIMARDLERADNAITPSLGYW